MSIVLTVPNTNMMTIICYIAIYLVYPTGYDSGDPFTIYRGYIPYIYCCLKIYYRQILDALALITRLCLCQSTFARLSSRRSTSRRCRASYASCRASFCRCRVVVDRFCTSPRRWCRSIFAAIALHSHNDYIVPLTCVIKRMINKEFFRRDNGW